MAKYFRENILTAEKKEEKKHCIVLTYPLSFKVVYFPD